MINSLFYIGSLNKNSNSYRRFQTYKQLLFKVDGLNVEPFIYDSITKKFDHHFNYGLGTIRFNFEVNSIDFSKYEAVLIDNRPFLFKSTLKNIRKKYPDLKIVLVLTDDPFGQYKRGWRLLKKTASLIDIHFVQRNQNIRELLNLGANKVEMCYRSYDPDFHRLKPPVRKNIIYDAGFIGSYEEQREESIKFLIENGIKVQVIGDGWVKGKYFKLIKPYYCGASVYGEFYVDYINSMQIALHFLRVGNRDEQDSRTFEIPACGTPMIAEYSDVHASLFTDDEVLFFKSNEELLRNVRYFMENPTVACEFAVRASRRCLASGYTHNNTLKKVLNMINSI